MTSPVSISETTIDRLADACERSIYGSISVSHRSLHAAWQHQFSARGKRSRMRLAIISSVELGLNSEQSEVLASACELVHQASLIHDDLMDSDTHRNGKPTVWHAFGPATAICLGDALLVEAMCRIVAVPNVANTAKSALAQLFRDSIHAAADGQIDDCSVAKIANFKFSDYCIAVRKKSGALFALPVLAAMIARDFSADEQNIVWQAYAEFGIAYQLLDDLHDKDEDKGQRLNGYWILQQESEQEASEELYAAVVQHLSHAETLLNRLPNAVKHSFFAVRDDMLAKVPKLKAVI